MVGARWGQGDARILSLTDRFVVHYSMRYAGIQCLSLVTKRRKRFQGVAMSLAITALCSLGEVEAARAEAARIEATHPGSALARKASGMCRVGPATGTAGPGM